MQVVNFAEYCTQGFEIFSLNSTKFIQNVKVDNFIVHSYIGLQSSKQWHSECFRMSSLDERRYNREEVVSVGKSSRLIADRMAIPAVGRTTNDAADMESPLTCMDVSERRRRPR